MTVRGYGRGYTENLRPRIIPIPGLSEIGLHLDIKMPNGRAKGHITSMDDPYNRWKEYHGIDSEMTDDPMDVIQEYVTDRTTEENKEQYLEWKSQDALIHWATG